MWVELTNGNYASLDTSGYLVASDAGQSGVWTIRLGSTSSDRVVAGISESTEAAAQDAIRRLVHGIDASTVL